MGDKTKFVLAQLKYKGHWNPRPSAAKRLVWEAIKRTSVEARIHPVVVQLADKDLFRYPFIYMAGDEEFALFPKLELDRLRKYLKYGGTLLIDNAIGDEGVGFDASVRRLAKALFPDTPLKKLGKDHSVFRSFYLLDAAYGRLAKRPYLEGVTLGDRTCLIYCPSDLGGAWSRDNFGNWTYEVYPGGMRQRTLAYRLGVNIVIYALTVNYKQDQVHIPFILRRRR